MAIEIYLLESQSDSASSQNSQFKSENNLATLHPYSKQKITFQGLFSLKGCYTRGQYWSILVAFFFFEMILASILHKVFPDPRNDLLGIGSMISSIKIASITLLVSFPITWIMIATSVKRFHDINKSGAWIFFNLIPLIGNFIVFIMNGFVGTKRHGNLYCLPVNSQEINTDDTSSTQLATASEKPPVIIPFLIQNKKKIALFLLAAIAIAAYFVFRLEHYPLSKLSHDTISREYRLGYGGKRIMNGCVDQELPKKFNIKELEGYADKNGIVHLRIKNGHIFSGVDFHDYNQLTRYEDKKPIERKVLEFYGDTARVREIITWNKSGEALVRSVEDGFKQAKPYEEQSEAEAPAQEVEAAPVAE